MIKSSKVKIVLSLLLVAMIMISVSACGATNAPAKEEVPKENTSEAQKENAAETQKTFKIGVAMADFKIPFFVRMMNGMEQAAKEYGIELDIRDGKSDPNEQTNQIETFITQKKDMIIIVAAALDALVPVAKKCNDAGIPIMTINRQLGEGAKIVTYVGCDDVMGGRIQGELLNDLLGGKGNVVLCQGSLGSSPQVMREQGLEEYIKEKAPDIKIIAKQNEDWDKAKTIAVVQNFLTRFPKGQIDAIVTQGPYEAVGAVEAVKAAGRDELLGKIIGFDLPQEVVDEITKGTMYGTVLQDPGEQGNLGVKTAYLYLTGKGDDIKPQTWTDLPKVNVDNIKDYGAAW